MTASHCKLVRHCASRFYLSTGDNAVITVSVVRMALGFLFELLLTAVIVGALAGWLIGRSRQAALATAVAR